MTPTRTVVRSTVLWYGAALALTELVVGVWTSGVTGSLVPAMGGAMAGALGVWLLSRDTRASAGVGAP